MKNNKLIVAVCLSAIALLCVPGYVLAQSQPKSTKPGSSLEQRLTQRKSERQVKLDKEQTQRITGRCVDVQTKLRELQQKYIGLLDNRAKTYQRIDAKMWVTIGELKLAEKDTYGLERQRAQYSSKVEDYKKTSDNFKQTLEDLTTINCQADARGFKALLDTARIYHKQLGAQSEAIRLLIVDDIKNTLSRHAEDLQPKTPSGGEQ